MVVVGHTDHHKLFNYANSTIALAVEVSTECSAGALGQIAPRSWRNSLTWGI